MNNFDLRKYLAEGKLRVNEGDMDHLMQDLEKELKSHDWFYYMSDDPRIYNKGTLEQGELKRLLKMLNHSQEAKDLYNKYAPTQDGIDLRITEELSKDKVTNEGKSAEELETHIAALSKARAQAASSGKTTLLNSLHRDISKAQKELKKVLAKEPTAAVKEEYNVGKGMEKDHDFDAMLDHALKLHAGTSIEDLKKVAHDFTDVNYHREVAYLEDAIDMLEAGKHEEFEDSLKLFKDEVEKTIRSFNESIKEGQGDSHHYIKVPTREYKKAQAILNQNIDPTYVKMEVVDNDGAGNVIFYFIFKHEYGFDDMYDDSGDQDSEFYQEPEEDGGAFVYDAAMDLRANDITVVSHSADDLAEGDYDPDQEQLDDEDEIFMPMDDEGRPLEEAVNAEVTKAVNRFIKGLAKKYDYSERDAVFAIQAALKQRSYDNVNEATRQDLGMSSSVSKRRAKAELKNPGNDGSKVYGLDKDGKRVHLKSINDVDKFKKFELDADIYEVNEDLDIGHEDNEPGMIKADLYKIGKYAMDLYKMMDSFEGAGEVDFPHWWQSKISTAKSMIDGAKHYLEFELKEPAIDATIDAADMEESIDREFHSTSKTSEHPNWEDLSAEEIQDYIDANPDTLWGRSLSIAKMILAQKREEEVTEDNLEEDSFYTKDVKDAVVSKLMDQLKK